MYYSNDYYQIFTLRRIFSIETSILYIMTKVNTVLGSINTSTLGFTLMHEHLMVSSAGIPQNYPKLLGEDYMNQIVNGLIQAKEGGIDTIVDATTLDLGRNIPILAEASRRSGINIVATTGWWLDIPRYFDVVSADQFAELFICDIREGISGSDVRAGILKGASDISGVTSIEENILRGVARAHLQTGIPIMLHSYSPGQVGKQQIGILKEEGVDLGRVKLDHSNDTADIDYLMWLLEQGCYLGLDRYPGSTLSPLVRTMTMKRLIDAGYVHRLLPSHDHTFVRIMGEFQDISISTEEKQNPYGKLYMKKIVFTQLLDMGVSEETIKTLCVDNPKNFFDGI